MLQLTLLYILVGLALALGLVSNLLYVGALQSILYVVIVLLGAYYIVNEITCVVKGKCYVLSWMHTIAAAVAFGSLCIYYLYVLTKKYTIGELKSQPLMENQFISSAVHSIKTFTGIDLTDLQN
jgi:hypothetical protein